MANNATVPTQDRTAARMGENVAPPPPPAAAARGAAAPPAAGICGICMSSLGAFIDRRPDRAYSAGARAVEILNYPFENSAFLKRFISMRPLHLSIDGKKCGKFPRIGYPATGYSRCKAHQEC